MGFGFACAVSALAETLIERDFIRQQSALKSGWVFGLAHDGGCSVMATARSASGAPAVLSLGWVADDGYTMMLTPRPFSQFETASIEVAGTTRSYSFPNTRTPRLTGHDVAELKQDISAGRALRLSGRVSGEPSERFDFPAGSGAMAIAALEACADMFTAHSVPSSPEFGNTHMVHAHNLESSCSLSGFWSEAGGFWIVIEAARAGATVRIQRLVAVSGTAQSGTIDLRGLGGDVMNFSEEIEMPFASERITPLEHAFLAGESRSIRVELTGQATQVLEFGGSQARAPAAMFSVCRSMLKGSPAAP